MSSVNESLKSATFSRSKLTNPVLSNEVASDAVVLWQYDHAPNLLALLRGFNRLAHAIVTRFWDYFRDGMFNPWTADGFGLNVLGRLLGLPRPTVLHDGVQKPISNDFYRRLLLGRFFLFNMSPTTPNYNRYLHIIYGDRAQAVKDGADDGDMGGMAMTFLEPAAMPAGGDALDEEKEMHDQHPELIYFYPAGIKTNLKGHQSGSAVGFDGQSQQPFANIFDWTEGNSEGGMVAGNDEARYLPVQSDQQEGGE